MMGKPITMIERIGPDMKDKLSTAGIFSLEGLLERGASRAGRKAIADALGLDESKILVWVNMADLFRINGLTGQFAELLKAVGVDTVKELRNRNAENLYTALVKTQEEKGLTRVVPSASKVADFIEQAKEVEPIVIY